MGWSAFLEREGVSMVGCAICEEVVWVCFARFLFSPLALSIIFPCAHFLAKFSLFPTYKTQVLHPEAYRKRYNETKAVSESSQSDFSLKAALDLFLIAIHVFVLLNWNSF